MTDPLQIKYPNQPANHPDSSASVSIETQVELYAKLIQLCRERGVVYRFACPTKEAAEFLGVSTKTLERMRIEQVGPRWILVGRSIRYPMGELWDWLQRQPMFDDMSKMNDELSARRAGVA